MLVIKTRSYEPPRALRDNFFSLGLFEGEAHLYDLATGQRLGATLFTAQGRAIDFGFGIDFTLEPDTAVRTLTDRLYDSIHESAAAAVSENESGEPSAP